MEQIGFYWNRIFHPTDFSDVSETAFIHALRMAAVGQSRLTILHTDSDGGGAQWSEFPKVRQVLERWGLLPANSSKEAVARLGMDVEKITARHGGAVESILSYLKNHPHDLIVLATHQHGTLDRWFHGVAEPIARRSGEITMFVPDSAEGFISTETGEVTLRNILIPVDREPHPQFAVDAAASIADRLGCRNVTFHLIHVGEDDKFPEVRIVEREGWRWKKAYFDGEVERQILDAAAECEADLIVMATQGHHGFLDALRGSSTERVVRASKCPVMAVPAYVMNGRSFQEASMWRLQT